MLSTRSNQIRPPDVAFRAYFRVLEFQAGDVRNLVVGVLTGDLQALTRIRGGVQRGLCAPMDHKYGINLADVTGLRLVTGSAHQGESHAVCFSMHQALAFAGVRGSSGGGGSDKRSTLFGHLAARFSGRLSRRNGMRTGLHTVTAYFQFDQPWKPRQLSVRPRKVTGARAAGSKQPRRAWSGMRQILAIYTSVAAQMFVLTDPSKFKGLFPKQTKTPIYCDDGNAKVS